MEYFDNVYNLLWDVDGECYALHEKKRRARELVLYMLDRSQQIFKWVGLPDTIPAFNLESILQTCGNVCITEVTETPEETQADAGLYAFWGGLGGEPNAYYEPTVYTVANPYLRFNKELKIGVDCIRVRNDKNALGLIPMFTKYAAMLNENEISLNMLSINYRIDNLVSADNDRTYESAKQYFKDIVSGKFGVVSSTEFFEGLQTDKSGATSKNIKDLIEYEQYLSAKWYNEIGLNSNYNMKRERIVSSEAQLNDDALIPLVENMLMWRQKAVDDIKEMYGDRYNLDDLAVYLNPIWDLDNIYMSIPEGESEDAGEVSERLENESEDENIDSIRNDLSNGVIDNSDDSGNNDIDEDITEDTDDTLEDTPEDAPAVEVNITVENAENVETTEDTEETDESEENDNGDITDETE